MTIDDQDALVLAGDDVSSASKRSENDAQDHQALMASVTGHPEAFSRLVERHAAACLRIARQVLRDEGLAQDAVQEAYLDLWKHAGRFDAKRSTIGPWLVMLSHRRAVDRVRVENRRPRPYDDVPDRASGFDLEEHTSTVILGEQTVALLRRLPDGQRRCLMLAYWGGYTMAEIALLLDIPVGTVKTRCKAALKRLRVLVVEQGLDPRSDVHPLESVTR